jgi:hypothetical protein
MMAFQVAAAVPARDTDTTTRPRPRPHAVEYSDAYATRLKVHRIGSYAMLPLAAGEYILGNQLLQRQPVDREGTLKSAHGAVAAGLGVVFGVNTVTGLWNLWDARSDPAGRTRRTVHAVTLLASDAGFLWAAALADGAHQTPMGARRHRNIALGSISVAAVGTAMMWVWKN